MSRQHVAGCGWTAVVWLAFHRCPRRGFSGHLRRVLAPRVLRHL